MQAGDEELCVRFIPLSVLVYEAIVEEILQYDYAPSPRPICYEVNISIKKYCAIASATPAPPFPHSLPSRSMPACLPACLLLCLS